MAQAPSTVWAEVRFTSDGISISLLSESQGTGAIVEDEAWFTFEELQEMSPSAPQSMNLSQETQEALAEQRKQAAVGKLFTDSQQSGSVENLPEVGDTVVDTNPPKWSQDNELEVVGISDKSASEYVIEESDFGPDKTVSAENPKCHGDETVIEAEYTSGDGTTYAFPESRLDF
jgi:hypothetical protein